MDTQHLTEYAIRHPNGDIERGGAALTETRTRAAAVGGTAVYRTVTTITRPWTPLAGSPPVPATPAEADPVDVTQTDWYAALRRMVLRASEAEAKRSQS